MLTVTWHYQGCGRIGAVDNSFHGSKLYALGYWPKTYAPPAKRDTVYWFIGCITIETEEAIVRAWVLEAYATERERAQAWNEKLNRLRADFELHEHRAALAARFGFQAEAEISRRKAEAALASISSMLGVRQPVA